MRPMKTAGRAAARRCGCERAARPSPGCRARSCSASARPRPSASAARCSSPCSLSTRPAGSELYNTNNRNTPDGLANLPKDYTGLPKSAPQLGPPLPGDLGRPILNAGAPAPGMPTPDPDPEQQRIAQEQQAALTSHLFATTNVGAKPPRGSARQRRLRRPPRPPHLPISRRRTTSSPS